MKKELSIIVIILNLSFGLIALGAAPISVLAQPTSTETPIETTTPGANSLVATDSASTATPSDIRKLRDRLASVVAELRKKDEQVIAGEVKSIDTTNLEVDTISSIVEKIQLDDTLTKYYRISGAAKEEIAQKDLKQGSYAIVTGLRTEGSFSANEIYIDEPFDSKAELKDWLMLRSRVRAGEIITVGRQPPFLLPGGIIYSPDFIIVHLDYSLDAWDTKGYATQVFINKRKQFEEIYPDIKLTIHQTGKPRKKKK